MAQTQDLMPKEQVIEGLNCIYCKTKMQFLMDNAPCLKKEEVLECPDCCALCYQTKSQGVVIWYKRDRAIMVEEISLPSVAASKSALGDIASRIPGR